MNRPLMNLCVWAVFGLSSFTGGCQEAHEKKTDDDDDDDEEEEEEEEDNDDDDDDDEDDDDEEGDDEDGDQAAEASGEDEAPTITAANYDGSPMTPSQFVTAFNPWVDKKVLIAAHPVFFWDEGELTPSTDLNMDPTNRDIVLASCEMKTGDDEEFSKTRVLILEGQFDSFWGPESKVVLSDCVKIELRDEMPPRIDKLDPARYDGTSPIPLDQYLEAMQWTDKEVVLMGSFNGSTTSTTDYGTSFRIDLYDEGQGSSEDTVAAYLDDPVPKENYGTSKVWKLKCQATGKTAFDRPEVHHCEFLDQVK